MSFWKGQPLAITDNVSQIISTERMIEKVNNEIDAAKTTLEYKVSWGQDAPATYRATILDFLYNNYMCSENAKVKYSDELFSYYLNNSILIVFHPKGRAETIVGVIVGRRNRLFIHGVQHNMVEVDFLSLTKRLHSLKLAPYMIGVLTREVIVRYEIAVAYYTIGDKIASPSYGEKKMYYRPIHIRNLVLAGFLPDNTPIKPYEVIFNRFKALRHVTYSNGTNQHLAEALEEKILAYSKRVYSIFDYKDAAELSRILSNTAFHSFTFYDAASELTDFICLYRVDSHYTRGGRIVRNGYLFIKCLSSDTIEHASEILEAVSGYCVKNNVLDLITVVDIFPTENYLKELKCIEGDGTLSYYAFNMNMTPIENIRNGIVTI